MCNRRVAADWRAAQAVLACDGLHIESPLVQVDAYEASPPQIMAASPGDEV